MWLNLADSIVADLLALCSKLHQMPIRTELQQIQGAGERGLIDFNVLKKAKLNVICDVLYGTGKDYLDTLLAESGAKSVTVPYRANRAVIFDSDLFHETDQIAFKEGYLNRRINITMLYGTREQAAKPA